MYRAKYLSGVITGLAIGAVAGILFAPEKGSVTRKRIIKKGEDFSNDLIGKVDGFSESIKETLHTAINDVEKTVAKGEATVESVKGNMNQGVSASRHF